MISTLLKRLTIHTILAIFTLTLLITSQTAKTTMPEIQGLYELFTPDVIGIGQALKTKGWIENVYDFAPKNEAQEVIKVFWYKISENEMLKVTNLAPVSEITPEIFVRIVEYIRKFKSGNDEERKKIAQDWYAACQDYITNKLPVKVFNNIERAVEKLKKENDANTRKQPELIKKNQTLEIEIKKLREDIKNLRTEKKEFVTEKEKLENKEAEIRKIKGEIKNLEANIKTYPNKLKKLEESQDREIERRKSNIEVGTTEIIKTIEKLASSQDFIPETAEAILWAFFEDKFTAQDKQKAQENLDACLNQIKTDINREKYDKKKLYTTDELSRFKKKIESISDNENIITEITQNYDESTYSSIKITELKIVPPAIFQSDISFWLNGNKNKQGPPFATRFESTMLDTLSILLYDPEKKIYDLQMLPKNETPSKFFNDVINNVFEFKQIEDKDVLIDPTNINTKYQNWINIIENKNEYAIEYVASEHIAGEKVNFNLNTRLENLIKILNEFYSLGLKIEYNQTNPKVLVIENFDKVSKEKPINAKKFWDKIFDFISKKLSTDSSEQKSEKNRTVTFKCKLDHESKPELKELQKDKISISGSYGKISVEIKYSNHEYKKFDIDFDLNIQSSHSYVQCPIRDLLGLDIYKYDLKNLLKQKIYAEKDNQKLLPLFILLADLNTLQKTDIKMQNLLFYCMKLKNNGEKYQFIINIAGEGLFEDQSFKPVIKNFIEKILTNEYLTSELLSKILKIEKTNQIIDEIINAEKEKNPSELLLQICKSTPTEWTNNIATKIMQQQPNNLLKSNEQKFEFIKTAAQKGLFEDKSFRPVIKNFIAKISKNEYLASQLIDEILKIETTNQIIDEIINAEKEKNPSELLLQICKNKPKEWTNDISKTILKEPDLEISKFDNNGSILSYAQTNNHKQIIPLILEHKNLANFDKFSYYANQGNINEAEIYIDKITNEEFKNNNISTIIFRSIINKINEEFFKKDKFLDLIKKLNLIEDQKDYLISKIALTNQLSPELEILLNDILSNFYPKDPTALQDINTKVSNKILEIAKIKNPSSALIIILQTKNDRTPIDLVNKFIDKVNSDEIQIKNFDRLFDEDIIMNKLNLKYIIFSKYHITSKLNNKKIKDIISKNPLETLFATVNMKEIDKQQKETALKIINSNPELEISTIINYQTALTVAAENKHTDIAEKILNHPKTTNFDKLNYFVITGNNQEAIQLILNEQTQIDGPTGIKCNTPLYYAVEYGNEEIVKQLLAKPEIDVNKKYRYEQTPLHKAVEQNLTEVVKLLLANEKVDLTIKNIFGKTPLNLAEKSSEIKLLINNKIKEIEERNKI